MRAILVGWTDVQFVDYGPFEVISGVDPQGEQRVGHSQNHDAEDIARHMAALAQSAGAETIRVEAPGIPAEPEWHAGTMPGGRDVLFQELDYELPPADTHASPAAPSPVGEDSNAPAGDSGSGDSVGADAAVGGVGVMLTVDERKNALSVIVGDMALDRAEAAETVIRNTDEARLNHLLEMDLASEEDHAALAALYAAKNKTRDIYAFALRLQRAIRDMDGAQLDALDLASADWPA